MSENRRKRKFELVKELCEKEQVISEQDDLINRLKDEKDGLIKITDKLCRVMPSQKEEPTRYEQALDIIQEQAINLTELEDKNKQLLTACESALDYGDPKNMVDAELARVAIYNILQTAIRTAKGE